MLGRIADPSGAVLADVKIILTNQATGVVRDAATSGGGTTYLSRLCPKYDVTFEHPGFKKNVQKDVTVEVNQVVTLEFGSTIRRGAGKWGR